MSTTRATILSSLTVAALVACGGGTTSGSDAAASGDAAGADADAAIKDAPNEGDSTNPGVCGDGTPLGCTNGTVDCCPRGAPCRAPEPFCGLGGNKCTPGDC